MLGLAIKLSSRKMRINVVTSLIPRIWRASSCRHGVLVTTTPFQKAFISTRPFDTSTTSVSVGLFKSNWHRHGFPPRPCSVINEVRIQFYSATPPSENPKPPPAEDFKENDEGEDGDNATGFISLLRKLSEKVYEFIVFASFITILVKCLIVGTVFLVAVIKVMLDEDEGPVDIRSHAFQLCQLNQEVQEELGTPIQIVKGSDQNDEEMTSWEDEPGESESVDNMRDRAGHQTPEFKIVRESDSLRMSFEIKGPFQKGTVNLNKKKNEKGEWVYTSLTVDVNGDSPRTIELPVSGQDELLIDMA